MPRIYVRVQPKKEVETFFRCAMQFTRAWRPLEVGVDVDAATVARLRAEQMLEVSIETPADYVEPPNEADPSGSGESAASSGTSSAAPTGKPDAAPTDPEVRLAAIVAAIRQFDAEDNNLYTAKHMPKIEVIQAVTGWPVSAAERDAAVAQIVAVTKTGAA